MIHKFCDGSEIKFKPRYQTTSECLECGHVSKIKPILINKPNLHKGPFDKGKCLACGKKSFDIGLLEVGKILEKRLTESIIKDFEQTDRFFMLLEKK